MTITEPLESGVDRPVVMSAATRMAQLAWAIASAPLLNHALAPHPALAAAEAQQWWREWQPNEPPPAQPDLRLGSDFERLWQYWLTDHPRWRLCAHNLSIREQNRTLGEFDLIVEQRGTAEQEHWELAVKFYLGYGDLDQPTSWHGPQFRDRLDRKLQHLRDVQLCWRERAAGLASLHAAGLAPVRERAIVKGRLCYPLAQADAIAAFAAPAHERGLWATVPEWQQWLQLQQQPELIWAAPLARNEWLAPATPIAPRAFAAVLAATALEAGQRPLALQLGSHEPDSYKPDSEKPDSLEPDSVKPVSQKPDWPMVFVVPSDWPARAMLAQQQID